MAEAEKILIVDDSPINIDFLLEILDGYDVRAALSAYEAETLIKQDPPDLILLDVNMPEKDGYTFCKELKADRRWRHIPVIFLSARNEGEDIVRGFKVGGADYVTKPFLGEVILARIQTQLRLRRAEKHYQEMLRRDDLSGLLKRSLFVRQAEQWVEHAAKHGKPVALLAIGIGNLETINRQFGFAMGDEVIKVTAKALMKYSDKQTLTTRQGGGLFLYLKYGMEKEALMKTGTHLTKEIDETQCEKAPNLRIITEHSVSDNSEAQTLYEMIELALKNMSIYPAY